MLAKKYRLAYKTYKVAHKEAHYHKNHLKNIEVRSLINRGIGDSLFYLKRYKNVPYYYQKATPKKTRIRNRRLSYNRNPKLSIRWRKYQTKAHIRYIESLKIELDPKSFSNIRVEELYHRLAHSYWMTGNTKLAIQHYKKVIQMDSNFDDAYLGLGIIYTVLNKNKLAIEIFQKYFLIKDRKKYLLQKQSS
jgi:tetratricopeptide (TPR) repeat protein